MNLLIRVARILILLATAAFQPSDAAKPNVLFIAIDDLNDWIEPLGGHPLVKTPQMNRLAAMGTTFVNAHCQAPLCNPSRASLLTGLRPSTTGIYGLAPGIRSIERTRDVATLPQHFRKNGYYTYTCGKIYHDGSIPASKRGNEFDVWGPAPGMPRPDSKFVITPENHPLMDWGVFPENDTDQADWKIADAAIKAITSAPTDRPFFIAAGFRLPHVPCYASQQWFDLYPADRSILPPVRPGDRDDVPFFAWYLHWKLPEPRLSWANSAGEWIPLVRAYLATISFVDSQVGRLLEALENSGRAQETVIVLWSDHGYHLGEKAITGKNSLWERSTRVPLFLAGPGMLRGARCEQPVELLDIYPTLVELCGLPAVSHLEGHSLSPLLRDAGAKRPWPAITTHNQGNHAIRSREWRYIRYADGSEELYHTARDPNEWTNLASDPRHDSVKRELAQWLPAQDAPPAPGSAHRVLVRSGDEWLWEGRPIEDGDLVR